MTERNELRIIVAEYLTHFGEGKHKSYGAYADDGEKFLEALLRWKHGKKYWCKHLIWDGQDWKYKDGLLVHGNSEEANEPWRFCPECGVKRPNE